MPERYLGRNLGKYRVTRLLGAGAFAWVYEAVDLDLEIPVALKILRPEYAGQPAAELRFRREATTAARLRHPNIVYIRDVGEAEGTVFVAMDLLPLSLARRLEVLPRLPEAEVVRIALDVAAALSIAHADGVVHRDIKPDNVMLGSNGEAVVADFGLAGAFTNDPARSHPSISDPGKVMGTPHYFSPEQARGLELDGRADLYALGVMCYRAVTGSLPFEGDDWYSVARQHVEDPPVPPRELVPEITEGFEAIVLRLLAKQPDARFSSATQLADALLMLPTAPVSRSVSVVPVEASVTQVVLPYANREVILVRPAWPRRVVAGAAAVAATAAFALLAMPSMAGLLNRSLVEGSNPPLSQVVIDSLLGLQRDPLFPNPDTAKASEAVPRPAVRQARAVRPPPPPAYVHVSLTAPDSANLTVNDQPVGSGTWDGDLPTGRPQRFRARLDGAIPGCRSAQHDTVITFSGASATLALEVAPCSVFLLTVRSTDADYTLIGRDFSFERKGRYLGTTLPIVLRRGRYELHVRAERCSTYNDTLTIERNVATGSDTVMRTVPLLCE